MIVGARICDLCGQLVTARTVHGHYVDIHGAYSAADWRLACWADGTAAVVPVDDKTFELEMSW